MFPNKETGTPQKVKMFECSADQHGHLILWNGSSILNELLAVTTEWNTGETGDINAKKSEHW